MWLGDVVDDACGNADDNDLSDTVCVEGRDDNFFEGDGDNCDAEVVCDEGFGDDDNDCDSDGAVYYEVCCDATCYVLLLFTAMITAMATMMMTMAMTATATMR